MTTKFTEWLEEEFERRKLRTLKERAGRLGMAQQTLHDLMNNPNPRPRPETVRKIADGLDVSLEQIYDRLGQPVAPDTPTDGRALPESVRGLSQGSFDYLTRMQPHQLERWIELMREAEQGPSTR